jgi:hypothetical protein
MRGREAFRLLCLLGLAGLLVLGGCDDDDPAAPDPGPSVLLDRVGDPAVDFDPQDGTTTVVVQFTARRGDGLPLASDDLEVTLQVDGRPIDVEGILQEDSEQLRSDLYLTLVLDASYSMLQHDPPAFGPMLTAARRAVTEGRSLYLERPGDFTWSLYWFNDRIFTPLESTPETEWQESDIERIPAPGPGTFTKLYAAAHDAVEASRETAESPDAGPRDQHVVVVLSDGADNYSWFANPELAGTGSVGINRSYEYFGYPATDKAQLLQLIGTHPALQLHVIGLGSAVNDQDLAEIAAAGHGEYFKNLDPSAVDALFDRVILEFASIQTRGATMPLPPGDYTFEVRVRDKATGAVSGFTFPFRGGGA